MRFGQESPGLEFVWVVQDKILGSRGLSSPILREKSGRFAVNFHFSRSGRGLVESQVLPPYSDVPDFQPLPYFFPAMFVSAPDDSGELPRPNMVRQVCHWGIIGS